MSAVLHTTGPWHAREWQCHAATSVGREVDGRFEQIAECSGIGRQVSTEQEEADATLIAAAPELLDAARDMEAAWLAVCTMVEEPQLLEHEGFLKLRAAIAKATGEDANQRNVRSFAFDGSAPCP